MRRVLLAALFVACSVGFVAIPAGADLSIQNSVVLSFDFSDNSGPAAASAGSPNFNVIADVLPAHTGGVVRMVAVAPASANEPNLICAYQAIQQSEVECNFNFSADGVWQIRAEYSTDTKSAVSSVSVTALRVTN
jgi:hypothetical protein